MEARVTRAGTFVRQLMGYTAFVPKRLPPDPPVQIDAELLDLLSRADRSLGRLDGSTEVLPNPDLFVAMFVRQEAVLSSQIEGTQASLVDILEYEADAARRNLPGDVGEVVNYVRAMNYGLACLSDLPLSLRLIREIHAELLRDVRGAERRPGEFRTSQNWIGPAGVPLEQAIFVPPPPHEMERALGDLELFLHDPVPLPVLLKCGMVHAQFETIHPFLDGNGRVGRLLITFLLVQQRVLRRPLLYLSYYLKRHRDEYYDLLQALRIRGSWEGWLKFFLRGVAEVANAATETARRILRLREDHRELIREQVRGATNALHLLEHLYEQPIVSIGRAAEMIGVSYPTASSLIGRLVERSLLQEVTGSARNRLFSYRQYLDLFQWQPQAEAQAGNIQPVAYTRSEALR
ncbi:MAG: Fic family protein [Chloroflexi bacterium]|nr:Fic family protein [Chloroflexota bacterium]